jgi:hypothetical protein
MPSKKPQFVIRADKEIFNKIGYIASENERSGTQEIVYLLKEHISKYEAKHGKLIVEEDGTVHPDTTYKVGKSSTSKIG